MAATFSEVVERLRTWPDAEHGPGVETEEVTRAGETLGLVIVGGYRDFLCRLGWCGVGQVEIYGLGEGVPPYLDLVQVTQSEREMEPPLAPYLLPLQNDGGGNLHCLDTRVQGEPPVVFWDHEAAADQTPEVIAECFADWLLALLDGAE